MTPPPHPPPNPRGDHHAQIHLICTFLCARIEFYVMRGINLMNLSSLQLDKAASILADLKKPISIAKIDADKYKRVGSKYGIEYVYF